MRNDKSVIGNVLIGGGVAAIILILLGLWWQYVKAHDAIQGPTAISEKLRGEQSPSNPHHDGPHGPWYNLPKRI